MSMSRTSWVLVCACVIAACGTAQTAAPNKAEEKVAVAPVVAPVVQPSTAKPVEIAGALPVAPFVQEQLALAPAGTRTIVYAGATWCEPCQRFHHALSAGELDEDLRGVRVIYYDLDQSKNGLFADGYISRLIPLFAVPNEDGRCSGKLIEGGIKGDGAVRQIVPRLRELLARK